MFHLTPTPTRRRAWFSTIGAFALLLALPGVAGAETISVTDAVSRAGLPNRPMAAYMEISNSGGDEDRLIAADSPDFKAIELHSVEEQDGVFKMHPVDAIAIPANGKAVLAQGGLHLMLFGAGRDLPAGESFPVTLTFEKAGAVEISVAVTARGKQSGHGHGDGHSHGHSGHSD
ncbi:MAG: copper chaperone PCu(A)C [Pseudomonadota bacterium]